MYNKCPEALFYSLMYDNHAYVTLTVRYVHNKYLVKK